jgi:hypothetical protein
MVRNTDDKYFEPDKPDKIFNIKNKCKEKDEKYLERDIDYVF